MSAPALSHLPDDLPLASGPIVPVVRALLDLVVQEGSEEVPLDYQAIERDFFGYLFHLRDWPELPARVRLSFRLHGGTPAVLWWGEPGREERRFVPAHLSWVLQPLVDTLVRRLPGHAFELDYTLAASQPLFPSSTFLFPDGWWDLWKDRAVPGGEGTVGDAYRDVLYPWLARVVADRRGELPERPTVLSVCGGDGEELAALVPVLEPLAPRLHVVDRNEVSLRQARERLGDRVAVHARDLDQPTDMRELLGGRAHLIVAMGAMNSSVLSLQASRRLAVELTQALAPGGLMVAGGFTPLTLNSDEFQALGLQVLRMTRPEAPRVWTGQQLYVLRKPLTGS